MGDVPQPEVTQSRDLSRDADATRAPDPALAAAAQSSAPSVQTRTWGDFQLLQMLGRGGFGEVYRAWDPMLEREVALKLLLPRGLDAEQEFTAIVSEARAMARVRHPNIVPVYGVDRREGRVGFWSEFVRGQTLNALIAAQGAVDEKSAAQIGIALCDALAAVHAAGLLHRDIKPGNAMRDENGRILLMDFGLSQNLLASSGRSGTPAYLAPEVAAGQPASVQSDLYAMGVLLRFLTTGAVSPSAQPPHRLAAIVRRATEADPHLRHSSAAQMRAELDSILAALVQPSPTGQKKKPKKERTLADHIRQAAYIAIGLAWVFVPALWHRLHNNSAPATSSSSSGQPAYQSYLAATAALNRYDIASNTGKAIGLYQAALKTSPEDALSQAGLARAYWRKYQDTGDAQWADEANASLAAAVKSNPDLAEVQMTAGSIHVDQGNFNVGLEELQKAQQLDPRNADVHAAMAEAYRQQQRTGDAKNEFQKAIDLDPENWRWPYLLGAMQIDAGDFKDAEANLKTALEKTPQNARVLCNLGIMYMREYRLNEARTVLEKSVKLDQRPDSLMALGSVLFWQGDFENAIEIYKQAADAAPTRYDAWGNLAEAYAASGQHKQEAEDTYRKAIELAEKQRKSTPDDAYLISALGIYYADVHDAANALPLVRKAIALAPNDADVVERAGESYEELGQRQQALKYIAQALQLGYSASYAKADPALKALRQDPDAPPAIRETNSLQIHGGKG